MNIYIDCGFYCGNALRMHMDAGTIDDTWTMYAFDPSPQIKEMGYFEKFPNVKFIEKAVWTDDGEVEFWESERTNANFVEGTSYAGAPKEKITVPSIDFSEFVLGLPEAYIICSMDIEGSEYKVLEKMIKTHAIDKINELDVEFHHRFMADYDVEDSQKLVKEITSRGVRIRLKEAFQ